MSLLIKALDQLDKKKQAETSKELSTERVADKALMLELMPVESKLAAQAAETQQADSEGLASEDAVEKLMDDSLSLEEEAGLTNAHIAASKYSKVKPSIATGTSNAATKATEQLLDKSMAKPSDKAATVKNGLPLQSGHAINTAASTKTPPAFQNIAAEHDQKAAAKVFVANKEVKNPSSISTLVILGVAGALLLWLGLQGYSYIKTPTAHDVVIVQPAAVNPSVPSSPELASAEVAAITPAESPTGSAAPNQETLLAENQPVANVAGKTNVSALENNVQKKQHEKSDSQEDVIQSEPKKSRAKKASNSNREISTDSLASYNTEPTNNAEHKPLKLISKAASSGVDPTLMAAYQAYTHGDDIAAQQQYRQVLQHDVRNVDALLGMAAIAQRQGRDVDAAGWYQKVLEIDPKNSIALSAMVSSTMASPQANGDAVAAESRIKSMLAQQPDAANLHAALGNVYIEQGQWPSAQEAYFNASRLAPNNADYAFNLAITLDQMGKTSLALKQYQRALEVLNKSGGASPDRAALETRIRELQ